jgi:hypothetical protein
MEDRWSIMSRQWLPTGVLDVAPFALSAAPLQVFADSTGMQVKVQPGAAGIRGFYYDSDAILTKSIAAANATNPRIDRVVLRLDAPLNTISVAVVQGTPAASPAVPSLTQTDGGVWELPLAQVRVNAAVSTIQSSNVTDERPRYRSADRAVRGEIGYGAASSTVSGLDGTSTVLAATQTVHVPAGRKIRVSAHVRGISGTAGDQWTFKVVRQGTTSGQLEESIQVIAVSGLTQCGCAVVTRDLISTAGSYYWEIQVRRVNGSGAGTVTVTSGGSVEIFAEDMGA